jgi:hypothetical protein
MNGWKIFSQKKGVRPLVVKEDGVICYYNGNIVQFSSDLVDYKIICKMPINDGLSLLGKTSRLVDRIFRLSPTHAILIEDYLFVCRRSEIWCCDLKTGSIWLDFVIPDGRHTLGFSKFKKPSGQVQIVFGDYFNNPSRRIVRIWGYNLLLGKWELLGEINTGEIEHIHYIDAIGDKIFVLCGDFNSAASIWISDLNFTSIKPILRGKQEFRAAWITELEGRIFYATDTQIEENFIYELNVTNGKASTIKFSRINGSSIYHCKGSQNDCYFSTAVECGVPTGKFLYDIFDQKLGNGILSESAYILKLNSDGSTEEIFCAEKDFYPFRLAQFGTFHFPSGKMPNNTVIAYGVALKNFDDTCIVFKK